MEMWAAAKMLEAHHIHFRAAVNEDLAATALWGSQYVGSFAGAKYDGVFGIWYGKRPGVDRSGDVFRHANSAGTSPLGGHEGGHRHHRGAVARSRSVSTGRRSSCPKRQRYPRLGPQAGTFAGTMRRLPRKIASTTTSCTRRWRTSARTASTASRMIPMRRVSAVIAGRQAISGCAAGDAGAGSLRRALPRAWHVLPLRLPRHPAGQPSSRQCELRRCPTRFAGMVTYAWRAPRRRRRNAKNS